jgi:hypothetical protein
MKIEKSVDQYQSLVEQISRIYNLGRSKAYQAVNKYLLETYWRIGQYIVEFEQGGSLKASYGKALLENLSEDLSRIHGKGFSRSNLNYMRLIYDRYPNCETLSHHLSWSHYVELLKIENELERSFYEKQCVLEKWSVRDLKRQKKAGLFLRLAASKDKEGVLQLAREGQTVESPADLIREPYVLEFLKIPEPYHLSIVQKINSSFEILNLGKTFTTLRSFSFHLNPKCRIYFLNVAK